MSSHDDSKLPKVFGTDMNRRQVLQGAGALAAAYAVGCGTNTTGGGGTGGGNQAPVWQTIPPQTWVVGQAVSFDLAAYCSDPDGDALTYSLSVALPAGLTLNGSVIEGTPTAVFPATQFTATADDNQA